jgi:hypothetical protein
MASTRTREPRSPDRGERAALHTCCPCPDGRLAGIVGSRMRRIALMLGLTVPAILAFAGVASASLGLPSFGNPQSIVAQSPYALAPGITGISCGLPTTCVAVSGTTAERTTNAGDASAPVWSKPAAISPANLLAVSCASTSLCVAVGLGWAVRSTDGGATWAAPVKIDDGGGVAGSGNLAGVSCASDGSGGEVCVAVDDEQRFVRSTDGGVTWTPPAREALPSTPSLLAVSCVAGATCVVGAKFGMVTISTNVTAAVPTWTTTTPGAADVVAVSCMPSGVCVAVDRAGNALISSDARTPTAPTWRTVDLDPASGAAMSSVSCTPAGLCVAGDVNGNAFVSGDVSAATPVWTKVATGETNGLSAMACGGSGWCVAGDPFGNAAYSADAAHPATAPWSTPVSLDGINSISDVSCTPGGLCGAVDVTGHAVTSLDGGATWSAPVTADRLESLRVSCVDAGGGTCVAVDADRNAVAATQIAHAMGPPTWVKTTGIAPAGLTSDVSCTEGGLCVVVTSAGKAVLSTDGGVTWSAAMATPDANRLKAVSCPASTLCVAVDDKGNAMFSRTLATANPTWSSPVLIDDDGTGTGATLGDISCTPEGSCVAVVGAANDGRAVVSSNLLSATPTWSVVHIAAPTVSLSAVSCTASLLCVVVDQAGTTRASTDPSVAASWSVVSAGSSPVTNVSCVKSGRCVAVDAVGNALVGISPAGKVALSGATGAFADTVVGAASATQTVTITNSGGATLKIAGTTALTGADAGQFRRANDTCANAALAPGEHCTVDVTFTPTSLGSHASATLVLTSDATSSPDSLALSGTAISAPATPPPPPPPPPVTPPPPPTSVTPPPPLPSVPGPKPAAPSNVVRFTKVTAGSRGAITVVLKIPGAGRFALTTKSKVAATRAAAGRPAQRAKTITYSTRGAGKTKAPTVATIRVKPGMTALTALRLHKRLRVVVSVSFTPTGGTQRIATAGVTVRST